MLASRAARIGKAEVGWSAGASSILSFIAPTIYPLSVRLITLNGMKASEEITEEQSRQLLFDVDHAYAEFFRSLSGKPSDPS